MHHSQPALSKSSHSSASQGSAAAVLAAVGHGSVTTAELGSPKALAVPAARFYGVHLVWEFYLHYLCAVPF